MGHIEKYTTGDLGLVLKSTTVKRTMTQPPKKTQQLYAWTKPRGTPGGPETPVGPRPGGLGPRPPVQGTPGVDALAFQQMVVTQHEKDLELGPRTRKTKVTPLPIKQVAEATTKERNKRIREIDRMIDDFEEGIPSKILISTVSEKLLDDLAVVEITNKSEDPLVHGGVNDTRMGVTQSNVFCVTCQQINCPGHFGKITLATPVINPMYPRIVIAILSCVCNKCGHLLYPYNSITAKYPEIKKLSGWPLLNAYSKRSAGVPCSHDVVNTMGGVTGHLETCKGFTNPTFNIKASKDKNVIYYDRTEKQDVNDKGYKTATEIYDILNSISQEDAAVLGFGPNSHPRDLVMRKLPVIPPITRPPVFTHGLMRSDQLTSVYSNIVEKNNNLHKKRNLNELGNDLFAEITKLIIGETKRRVNYNKLISILLRAKGKDGLFRAAMQGKRVNYSARGVISPGPDLEFGVLGVPEKVAQFFHMPLTVTQANARFVQALYNAGRLVSHTPSTGELAGHKFPIIPGRKVKIEIGDEVERMAQDGDIVIFNRQPSLHHGSFLAYTMKITPGDSFKLHPSSTTPHNADHDGDCGTVHYPRSKEAIQEAWQLMHANRNIIDDKRNGPMVGLIMDCITSPYLMTKPDEGIDPLIFTMTLDKMKTDVALDDLQRRAAAFGLHPWSGRTLFSALFPPDFYYENAGISIINGILNDGRVKAGAVGSCSRSVIQDMHKQYGYQRTADFITDATWLTLEWLDSYGFSIGPSDCDYGEDAEDERFRLLSEINAKIKILGPIPTNPILLDNYEKKVKAIVDESRVFGKKLAERKMSEDVLVKGRQNAIGVMAKGPGSGAKADLFNVGQMGGSVGPQSYHGALPIPKMSQCQRFLPTQIKRNPKYMAPMEERGYCKNSFRKGLLPEELYYTAWATRGDLINTNLQTATVGDAQRRMSKALENIIVYGDGSVRSISGHIYQFSYGGDGLESQEMLDVKTHKHGNVPSFVDVMSVSRRYCALGGWIRRSQADAIVVNRSYHGVIETSLKSERERGDDKIVPQDRHYGIARRIFPTFTEKGYEVIPGDYIVPAKIALGETEPPKKTPAKTIPMVPMVPTVPMVPIIPMQMPTIPMVPAIPMAPVVDLDVLTMEPSSPPRFNPEEMGGLGREVQEEEQEYLEGFDDLDEDDAFDF